MIRIEHISDTDVMVALPVGSVRLAFPGGLPAEGLSTGPSQAPQGLIVPIVAWLVIGYVGCIAMANISCGLGNVATASVYDWAGGLCFVEGK